MRMSRSRLWMGKHELRLWMFSKSVLLAYPFENLSTESSDKSHPLLACYLAVWVSTSQQQISFINISWPRASLRCVWGTLALCLTCCCWSPPTSSMRLMRLVLQVQGDYATQTSMLLDRLSFGHSLGCLHKELCALMLHDAQSCLSKFLSRSFSNRTPENKFNFINCDIPIHKAFSSTPTHARTISRATKGVGRRKRKPKALYNHHDSISFILRFSVSFSVVEHSKHAFPHASTASTH